MKLSELFTSRGDGELSHTKLWTNIAYGMATWVIYTQANKGVLTVDMMLVYLAVVGAHGTASKWISLRYSNGDTEQETKP